MKSCPVCPFYPRPSRSNFLYFRLPDSRPGHFDLRRRVRYAVLVLGLNQVLLLHTQHGLRRIVHRDLHYQLSYPMHRPPFPVLLSRFVVHRLRDRRRHHLPLPHMLPLLFFSESISRTGLSPILPVQHVAAQGSSMTLELGEMAHKSSRILMTGQERLVSGQQIECRQPSPRRRR